MKVGIQQVEIVAPIHRTLKVIEGTRLDIKTRTNKNIVTHTQFGDKKRALMSKLLCHKPYFLFDCIRFDSSSLAVDM